MCNVHLVLVNKPVFFSRADRSLATRLLMLLNSWDLAVCISATIILFVHDGAADTNVMGGDRAYSVVTTLTVISFEGSAFSTVLLSVTRTIRLCKPFYRLKSKAIALSFVVVSSVMLAIEATRIALLFYLTDKIVLSHWIDGYFLLMGLGMGVMSVTVFASNLVSSSVLLKRRGEIGGRRLTAQTRHATITVIILSILFCSANMTASATVLIYKYTLRGSTLVVYIAIWMLIPLNSAVNPVVYLCRKREMRRELGELAGWCRAGRGDAAEQEMELQTIQQSQL